MSLQFPDPPAPDATVVLVVHNAWEWTREALLALRDNTPPRYQLVVVDNASTDGAAEGLAELTGATVIRNGRNVGFGPAANQAAILAAARHLVFLNSDALVHPGWLEALLAIADAEPDVGAVGGRLLNLDGTLQEAGSLVWADGRVNNYGDGDDPDRPEYCFRRDVDHVSAALLLVRRSAFTAAGGFDPVYAPAYLEDVDLVFSLRARGLRIVYQPAATATHVRWASGDRSSTEALVERNLPIFRSRWATTLADRPAYSGLNDRRLFLAARDDQCVARLLLAAAEPDQSVSTVFADLARAWPTARLTLLVDRDSAPGVAASLRSSGVEVATPGASRRDWLDGRCLHYDAIVQLAPGDEALTADLAATQPQAPVVVHDPATGDVVARLVATGLSAPSPTRRTAPA